ncbi:PRC-barrel domain-containing protein [Fodinicurvata sp. EGI_FJ10296]|uniref:PRC-barrel domain-containing protein n=1 Tax=Fodinicurvata sp. EGI_FJ10296 TaxID=3231908 RepID=UPI003455AE74
MRSKLIAAVSALALTMSGTSLVAAQQDTDAGVGAETDIEAELETEGSTDGEADADVGADVDADADMDVDADADMGTETDTEAEAGADAGATVLGDLDTEALIGATVESSDGEELGEVEDVIQQGGGRILIETGGLLGLGAETKAVDVADITFDQENEVVVLSITEAEFDELPEYEGEE